MPRKSQKAKLILSEEKWEQLQKIAQSRKASFREVQRAKILLRYSEGLPIVDIGKMVHISRPTIYKCTGVLQGQVLKYHFLTNPCLSTLLTVV
ncbi:hypothetical protein HY02_00620 [Peptococcaceae bacterium SCADC1_2_3]|jgi:DNA-directed RNA polymerase specialized sigma24 family protein|nr:hypothetical protein HY02_00620 [Peptococcaceae bacterium SCADC1_2_3]